jgi:alginate O-acetyltransferase complex protein AlgI
MYEYSYGGRIFLHHKTKNFYIIAFMLMLLLWVLKGSSALFTLGISYLFFKLLYTTYYSINNESIKRPSRAEYIEYAFFPVTLPSGPINPFKLHNTPVAGSATDYLIRLLEGAIKLKLFSPIVFTLTYTELSGSGYELSSFDLIICAVAYYIYMYVNFSGLTDIVIAISGLLGRTTKENFNDPLKSVSIIDFWRRWHLSLTDLIRDVVFNPLYFILVKTFGARSNISKMVFPIIAMATAFLIMSLWHGFTAGFILYYLAHAVGFAINYIYQYTAKLCVPSAYNSLQTNRIYLLICWFLAFVFISFSYLLLSMGSESWKILEVTKKLLIF